jgi:hypothetical protein
LGLFGYAGRITVRDNFSAATKRLLAGRAGHHCSNPGCGQPTSGPALDESKVVNVGEAAHITAAAAGGKRYDPSLTPEERSAEPNGIWLCKQCAGLIDQDDERFTAPVLQKWKRDAVNHALKDITTRAPGANRRLIVMTDEDDEDREFLRGLALPDSDNIEAVVTRMRGAAARDIAAFRGAKDWPAHTIPLTLTLHAGEAKQLISIKGMADGIDVAETLNLVAPPGTGKTTTLVQLAGNILEATKLVAVLVPLGEWSDRREDFFTFLTGRRAFGAFRRQHFMQLAYYGRLRLILDGWNELDPDSRVSATRLLKILRREYPILGIVAGRGGISFRWPAQQSKSNRSPETSSLSWHALSGGAMGKCWSSKRGGRLACENLSRSRSTSRRCSVSRREPDFRRRRKKCCGHS